MAFELGRQGRCVAESAHGFLSLNLDCHAHSRVVEALFSEFHAGGDNHAARKRGFEQFVRPADPPVPSLKVSAIPEWSPDAYCACHRAASA